MSATKSSPLTPSDILVMSTDSELDYAARGLRDGNKKIKIPTLTELVKAVKDALDASGVSYWKTTLEVSLAPGGIGVKGTLELANK